MVVLYYDSNTTSLSFRANDSTYYIIEGFRIKAVSYIVIVDW